MRRIFLMILAATSLSACVCIPESEKGDSVDSGYFGTCWDEIKKDRREQVLFPKPT